MRIVQLLPELEEGGVERGVVELNRELVRLGHQSYVISHGGRLVEQIVADGGNHMKFDVSSKNPVNAPWRIKQLQLLLQSCTPDIVHARSRVPAWLSYLANRKLGFPFVTTVHGFNSVNRYSKIMTQGDKVICVSESIREYVSKNYSVPEQKLVVIPRGVDLEAFAPNNLDKHYIKNFSQQFNLTGKFVVSSVGRVTQLKDYETFIRSVAILKDIIPELKALIVGGVRDDKKDYFMRLQKIVADLNAQEYVHFTGSQTHVAEIYSISDVVVSSSKKPESFGRSAAEALAMNTPVAASAHGGLLDIVIPGKTGYLFKPGQAKELAEAIESCRSLSSSGLRDFVRDRFTLPVMVEKTLAVYKDVTKGMD